MYLEDVDVFIDAPLRIFTRTPSHESLDFSTVIVLFFCQKNQYLFPVREIYQPIVQPTTVELKLF